MATRKARARRSAKQPREPRGLPPAALIADVPPPTIAALAQHVERDGGAVIGRYRDPLGGHWQLLVALPIDKVAPTPFQRDLSAAHVQRLTARIDQLGRFLDPIIAVRRPDGTYWTPNGNHRLHALKALAAPTIVGLLVPDEAIAYQILALNTEKAHNLREKALEVIRMARDLAAAVTGTEVDCAGMFEDPELLTLGLCYEQNGRFAGGVYRPVLRRLEQFLDQPLAKALACRERRAALLLRLDAAVAETVARLRSAGLESPYLKNFVVARCNPLRFAKGGKEGPDAAPPDWDRTIEKMIASAAKFDAKKVGAGDLAAAGGVPVEE